MWCKEFAVEPSPEPVRGTASAGDVDGACGNVPGGDRGMDIRQGRPER